MFRLTIDMIFDLLTHFHPFQIAAKMKTKVQNLTKMSIYYTTVGHGWACDAPIDALMCPLQSSIDIESLSLTLNGVNACFIHHPSNVENYLIGLESEASQPEIKKLIWVAYSYTFLQIFVSKFKIPVTTEIGELFQHLANWYLMAQQMTQQWHTKNPK